MQNHSSSGQFCLKSILLDFEWFELIEGVGEKFYKNIDERVNIQMNDSAFWVFLQVSLKWIWAGSVNIVEWISSYRRVGDEEG